MWTNTRTDRIEGTITRLVTDRGFGVIMPDNGQRGIFFHANARRGVRFDALRGGERVSFVEEDDPYEKGPRAVDVRLFDVVSG